MQVCTWLSTIAMVAFHLLLIWLQSYANFDCYQFRIMQETVSKLVVPLKNMCAL